MPEYSFGTEQITSSIGSQSSWKGLNVDKTYTTDTIYSLGLPMFILAGYISSDGLNGKSFSNMGHNTHSISFAPLLPGFNSSTGLAGYYFDAPPIIVLTPCADPDRDNLGANANNFIVRSSVEGFSVKTDNQRAVFWIAYGPIRERVG